MAKTIFIMILAAVLTAVCGCSEPVIRTASEAASPSTPQGRPAADPPPGPDGPEPSIAEPTGELTLQAALALALLRSPQLKSDALDIRIAEADKLQASLRPNPDLELAAEEIGADTESGEPAELTIALSQLIELGDKRQKRTRLGELETRLAAVDYEARRLDVLTEVHARFVDILAAQRRAELMLQLETIAGNAAAAVDALVQAGKDSPLEKTRAQIRLSDARTQRLQAQRNLDVARKALAALWGSTQPRFDRAVGKFENTPPIASAETMMQYIDNNPDIARWAVALEQHQAAMQLEKAKGVPDMTVGGGVQVLRETGETAAVFGASIGLPLFDTNQGGRMAAAHRLAKAAIDADAAKIRIETRLKQAHRDAANALTRADELRDHVLRNAQTLFEATDQGYRAGEFEYLSLLDAQNTLSRARLEYIDALADYHKARAEMERLVGRDVRQIETDPGNNG